MKIRAAVVVLFLLAILPCAVAAIETPLSRVTPGDVAPPYRLRTSVASNGRGYVVMWEAAADPNDDVRSIYVRVLGADGVPLRPAPALIGSGREPRAVWNGREYLVVWGITSPTTGSLPRPSVVGMRLREDGSFIDPQPVTLVSEMNPFSERVTVAWNGSEYLIAWTRGTVLVSADLQHSRLVLIPSIGGVPTYSATAGDSFIILTQANTGSGWQLNAVQMSAAGAFGAVNVLNGTRGNIVSSGTSYAAMWDDETDLHFGLLRSDGSIVSSAIVAPGGVGFPRLATQDGRIVASWEWIRDTTNVCTARFDVPGAPLCSAPSANEQHDPSIGTSATSVLAVWSDQTSSVDARRRTHVADSVRVLVSPASGLPQVQAGAGRSISAISSTPAAEKRTDGSTWVAWSEYNSSTKHTEIHLGGKGSNGELIADRAVLAGDADQTSPVIAASLGRTIALWEEGPAGSPKIRMTIVDNATKSVMATSPLGAGSGPSVAFDGKEWLAAWQSASGIIRFAIINNDGDVIASSAMPAETPNSSLQAAPAVAWSGKTFFVTWRETIAPGSGLLPGERIEVATVSTAGVASPARTLDGAEGGLAAPSLAANGSRLLVSWGTPPATLRQMLFDDAGKQLSGFIDVAWPCVAVFGACPCPGCSSSSRSFSPPPLTLLKSRSAMCASVRPPPNRHAC
ncbi:MAG: hypothetical protein WB973_18075 [Thermoanaerobaculia bacterium]